MCVLLARNAQPNNVADLLDDIVHTVTYSLPDLSDSDVEADNLETPRVSTAFEWMFEGTDPRDT